MPGHLLIEIKFLFMREKVKDPGRIRHMLDAARLLANEIPIHTLDSVQENKISLMPHFCMHS